MIVSRLGSGETLPYDRWQTRPDGDVIGWTSVCECGWRGQLWQRVTDPADDDLAARRAYATDSFPPGEVEDACADEWQAHTRRLQALAEVTALAREHAEVGRRLDTAVAAARNAGASWAEVGQAAGSPRTSGGRADR